MLFNPRPHSHSKFHPVTGKHAGSAPLPPRTLNYDGRSLVFSGSGRAASMHVYIDLARGQSMDLALVQVTSITATHTFAKAHGNRALAVICIGNSHIPSGTVVGDWLIVGPLEFDADGLARAWHAWRPYFPAPRRFSGVVSRVHHTGRFGEIAGPNGKKLFFHVADCPSGIVPGVNLLPGQVVSYREEVTPKGLNAREVTPS